MQNSIYYIFQKGAHFMARESTFQAKLIKELKARFPGCKVLKNDSGYIQGFPDLTVLHANGWALLESKASPTASKRPNQEYYISEVQENGGVGYAAFIYPENKEEVLSDLQQAFGVGGATRVSRSE